MIFSKKTTIGPKDIETRKRALLRAATTKATSKHGIGGLKKQTYAPAPVTLPKLKCLEDADGQDCPEGETVAKGRDR